MVRLATSLRPQAQNATPPVRDHRRPSALAGRTLPEMALAAERADFRESSCYVLDLDVLWERVVEVQPLTGSRIDDVRCGAIAPFHRFSVPRSIRSSTSLVGPPDGRINPQEGFFSCWHYPDHARRKSLG